jgi:hypothetical protein
MLSYSLLSEDPLEKNPLGIRLHRVYLLSDGEKFQLDAAAKNKSIKESTLSRKDVLQEMRDGMDDRVKKYCEGLGEK